MPILNQQTYLSYYTSSLEPVRDENGNIISITSSEHPINEVSQFVERSSIYTYYTSSYLGQIFDFDFKELGVSSDERSNEPPVIPPNMLLISQSEYDYLTGTVSSLQIKVSELEIITGSLEAQIVILEEQVQYLLELLAIGGGGGSGGDLEILTVSLPNGAVGVAYNKTLSVQGGTTPYTWSTVGSLPNGLALSQGGVISGTPIETFNSNVIIKATDASTPAKIGIKTFALLINPAPIIPTVNVSLKTNGSGIPATGGVYTFLTDSENRQLLNIGNQFKEDVFVSGNIRLIVAQNKTYTFNDVVNYVQITHNGVVTLIENPISPNVKVFDFQIAENSDFDVKVNYSTTIIP